MVNDWRENCRVVCCTDHSEKDVKPVVTAAGLTKTMAPRREDTIATHSLPEVHNPWRFYQNVAAYLDGKEERIITLSQVSRVMRLMEAIKLSAETKQVINFEE